jgi:hypothetical protein
MTDIKAELLKEIHELGYPANEVVLPLNVVVYER